MFKKLLLGVATFIASIGFAFAEVDVNKADQAALDGIRGIGPSISKRILDERKKGGNFKDWNDFESRVKGIGAKSAAKMSQAGLTVNSQPMPNAPVAAAAAKVPAKETGAVKEAGASKDAGAAKQGKAAAPVPAAAAVPPTAATPAAPVPAITAKDTRLAKKEAKAAKGRAPVKAKDAKDAKDAKTTVADRPAAPVTTTASSAPVGGVAATAPAGATSATVTPGTPAKK